MGQKSSDFTRQISSSLDQKLHDSKDTESCFVSVSMKIVNSDVVRQYKLLPVATEPPIYKARLTRKEITRLAATEGIVFINEYHPPKEELSTGAVDYTLNKINLVRKYFPTINGDSIFVSVKERSFDTADIDLKGRVFSSGVAAPSQTSHASLMATIIAGAGNSSPIALGVAPSAYVGAADFANLFPEAIAVYQQKKISVQNHSYGTVVETFYGNEAMAYDQSVNSVPSLVHVFSAGNGGTTTSTNGTYAGIAGMANLTGNFKQSKNSISVTALDSAGNPMAAASKGPAYDGRVKPELAAYGEDGSSGAAALVSGTSALIQQAFQRVQGQLPNAAMVKSVLINSADDAGPTGIDYLTGYGSLNAHQALMTVLQNRVWQNSVVQGETKTLLLVVPSNTAKMKITLAWTDPAAQPNAGKALINDLDLLLRNVTTGETWEPWVLNTKANKDSLLQFPQRKKDTLNNVEQITVDAPAGGNYQVEVRGSKLSAAQTFAFSYQLDTVGSFLWTYPVKGEALLAKQTSVLRWQTNLTGNGTLEYSFDKTVWKAAVSGIVLSSNQAKWLVPDTAAVVFLRINAGGQQFVADSLVIAPSLNLNIGFVCSDSFQLNWAKLSVPQYRLYQLGNRFLEPVMTLSDTAIVLSRGLYSSRYFAVAPIVGGKEGLRSNTTLLDSASAGCYFAAFYLQSQTPSMASFIGQLGTLYNVREVHFQKLTRGGYETIQTLRSFTSTQLSFSDQNLLTGENSYRLELVLQNGSVIYGETIRIYHNGDAPVYLYPNPSTQGETIRVISTEPGRFTLRFVNSMGVEVYRQFITNSYLQIPASRFPKGLYFVWIMDKQGKPFLQKLLVQ